MGMNDSKIVLDAVPPEEEDAMQCHSILPVYLRKYGHSIDAIHIPDVRDGEEFGRECNRTPQLKFASQVNEWLRDLEQEKPLVLYRVVVHDDKDAHLRWMNEARKLGVDTIFLVGGDRSDRTYKGLNLEQAAELARREGFAYGGILIPTRRSDTALVPEEIIGRRKEQGKARIEIDETERLRTKIQEYGFSAFSTQILYETETMKRLLSDLREANVAIPKMYLSFCPVTCKEDIAFLRKQLGAYVPEETRQKLMSTRRGMHIDSPQMIVRLWRELDEYWRNELKMPGNMLAANFEYANVRILKTTMLLADEAARWIMPIDRSRTETAVRPYAIND